ncbi:MAG TPA: Ig-like domain-containing protein, partial [Candidatus Manganitrophaceae bacterium]|nr:Ig-like domain-containing protein [Candidatus Manganitrophaceae bacterium]
PSAPWAQSTTYNAVLTTGVKDLDGIPLPSNFSWSFETAGPDTTPPTVAGTIPAEGATNVSRNTPIMVSFSEPIKPETVNADTFFVSGGVQGSYEYDPSTLTAKFIPSAMLARNLEYQVTVTAGIQDLAGNGLEAKSWKFSTGVSTDPVSPTPPGSPGTPPPPPVAPPLPTSPLVLLTYPCSGMDRTRTDLSAVWVKFNQAISASNVDGPFILTREKDGASIGGSFRYEAADRRALFDPAGRLDFDTWYTAALDGIQSPSDGSVTQHHWRFKTEIDPNQVNVPDTVPPVVACTFPPNGSTVPAPRSLHVYFNEPIDPKTINANTFWVKPAGSSDRSDKGHLSVFWSYGVDREDASLNLLNQVNFGSGVTYEVTMTTGITDRAGNHLASNYVWSFTAR